MNVCALIPSYDPDERLVSTVKDLQSVGFRHIIVVDDGSRTASRILTRLNRWPVWWSTCRRTAEKARR